MNKTIRRLLAVVLIFSLLSTNFAFADDGYYNYQDEMENEMQKAEEQREQAEKLQEKYNILEQTLAAVDAQLKSAEAQKNYAVNKRAAVKAEINVIQEQIDNLNERMTALNSNIEIQEIAIVNKQMEIEESQTKFEYRLVANQTSGSTGMWTMLFSASSFSDFLTSLETIRQFAEYDTQLIKSLREDKESLEKMKTTLEEDKKDLEKVIEETDAKRAELDKKYEELNGEVYSLTAIAEQYAKNKAQVEADMANAQAEIDAFYMYGMLGGDYVGGEFTYPVPSTHYISSYYGWRTIGSNYSDFHTGIDFTGAGCYGAPIVAANSGTVTFTKTTYIPGKGYGKYLIVDHGGGKSTLYAHCSSIAVNVGDVVAKGQVIAYIGSTGFSTGAHLHFEIRINGQHVNPLPYMPGQS